MDEDSDYEGKTDPIVDLGTNQNFVTEGALLNKPYMRKERYNLKNTEEIPVKKTQNNKI